MIGSSSAIRICALPKGRTLESTSSFSKGGSPLSHSFISLEEHSLCQSFAKCPDSGHFKKDHKEQERLRVGQYPRKNALCAGLELRARNFQRLGCGFGKVHAYNRCCFSLWRG